MPDALRPIRFAVGGGPEFTSAEGITRFARKAESLGYSTVSFPDHLPVPLAPLLSLQYAADATSRLRISTVVLNNDFRHPVLLAKEAATLDQLSGGRFELGIGSGYAKREYDDMGLQYDRPLVRIARLGESITILKGLFAEGPFNFQGTYYQISDLEGTPKPVQKPYPPIMVGGGSQNLLRLAGKEADIVNIAARTGPGGQIDLADVLTERYDSKLAWIKEGAGARFDQIELAGFIFAVVITNDTKSAAQTALDIFQTTERQPGSARFDVPPEVTAEALIESPCFAIGTVKQIAEHFRVVRERFGISYFTVGAGDLDNLSPIIEELGGD